MVVGSWMETNLVAQLLLLVIAGSILSVTTMDNKYSAQDGISSFTNSFYKALKEDHPTDLISSPFSISMLMALLKIGTRGKSAQEIQSVFRFPENDDDLLSNWGSLLSTLQKANEHGDILSAANKIYVQGGFPLNDQFATRVQKYFHGAAEQLDFSNSLDSATTINNWVAQKTGHKIKNLFGPDSFDAQTSIVLVNALYFKGSWLNKFDSQLTEKQSFFVSSNEKVEVDMMMQSRKFPYANLVELDAQLISLPFEGGKLSMLILLPNDVNGIRGLESKLSNKNIVQLCSKLESTKVELSLPKFSLESSLDLKQTLMKLGISSIFEASLADFGGLSESFQKRLQVSKIIQKAFIEINEEGAEAAAATSAQIQKRSISFPVEFHANHPFIYAIVLHNGEKLESQNSTILFYGSLFKPSTGLGSPSTVKDEL